MKCLYGVVSHHLGQVCRMAFSRVSLVFYLGMALSWTCCLKQHSWVKILWLTLLLSFLMNRS